MINAAPLALKAVQCLVNDLGATPVGQPVAPVNLDARFESRLRLLGPGLTWNEDAVRAYQVG
ncbi:MAG: hypothetical protein EBS37_07310 [Betaproteobacteria bacterium]|nr:hypothetical protein [Betaproteobacteria bacterium]